MPERNIKRTEVPTAEWIPLQKLPANMEAAPPIEHNNLPPLLCYGVPIDDLDALHRFALANGYVPPPKYDYSDEEIDELAAKGWDELEKAQGPDPRWHLRAFCHELLYKQYGMTIQSVWDVGKMDEGRNGMIAIWIFCFYSNYTPKQERKLPRDFELLDEGAKPMWYYGVGGEFWAKVLSK